MNYKVKDGFRWHMRHRKCGFSSFTSAPVLRDAGGPVIQVYISTVCPRCRKPIIHRLRRFLSRKEQRVWIRKL